MNKNILTVPNVWRHNYKAVSLKHDGPDDGPERKWPVGVDADGPERK